MASSGDGAASQGGRLGEPLFEGRTATIHAWGDGRVAKLYRRAVPPASIERERVNLQVAHDAGLPVPDVGEAVEIDGRRGFLQARVDGPTLQDQLETGAGELTAVAGELGGLQARVLACPGDERLWPQRQVLQRRIEQVQGLSAGERAAVLAQLASLPDGATLCHGDFHPRNVIRAVSGPCLIDWVDATRGGAAADVARSLVIYRGSIAVGAPSEEIRRAMQSFHDAYLEAVLTAAGVDADECEAWVPVLAAARLGDGVTEQGDWLLAQARRAGH